MNERKTAMVTKKSRMPASSGRKYICVIADYGPVGDMAFAEVQQTLYAILRDSEVTDYKLDLTNVPAFDTYATGFKLAQLALNSALGEDHVFYVNTAPRKDKKSARINNEGEGLVYVQLNNGVHIVAVNSGYSLTFIKPFAKAIRELKVDKAGSQFRSRDIFPQAVGAILRGDMSIVGNRPLPLYEAERLTRDEWSLRFMAPAGLTGLWQVTKRGKSDMSVEERIALDVQYSKHYSFWTDLRIIFLTFSAFIQHENV